MSGLVAVDHCAGTGWGVALQRLGIKEYGVEMADKVVETRTLHGMETIYRDVWEGVENKSLVPKHHIYIDSPPCPTFSVMGNGAGRRALDTVLHAIAGRIWTLPAAMRLLEKVTDPRTALVLIPLIHVWQHKPMYIALEQVTPVLPIWEAMADVLREDGYRVWTGVVYAEQYGVPQARRRAVLMARRDGIEARRPTPTHSRYWERTPDRLDEGVARWVTMAEGIGWGLESRPSPTITGGGTATGGAEPIAKLARYTSRPDWCFKRPAKTLTKNGVMPAPGQSPHNAEREQATGRAMPGWRQPSEELKAEGGAGEISSVRLSVAEAALLQSYPAGFEFVGNKGQQFLQVGNAVPPLMAEAILDELTAHARASLTEAVAA